MPEFDASQVFISYRRADAGWAAFLADKLGEAFGEDSVFYDAGSLVAGAEFPREIERRLERAAVMLVLIGRGWRQEIARLFDETDWVHREIRLAFAKRECQVVPVLLDGVAFPKRQEVPDDIQRLPDLQYLELRASSSIDDAETLVRHLKGCGVQQSAARSGGLVMLTRPRPEVRKAIEEFLWRGEKGLLEPLTRGVPESECKFNELSKWWHVLRRDIQGLLERSFSTSEIAHRLTGLDRVVWKTDLPWEQRAPHLRLDVEKDLSFLKQILAWLDNYPEPPPKG